MLQIIQNEFFKCEKCHSKYTEDNYPISLSCHKNICLNCFNEMADNNNKCPFNESHDHTKENSAKNICFIKIMEEINNLVKGAKQKDIYAILDKFISDLKKEKDSIKTGDITFKGELEDNKPKDIGILKLKNIGEFEGSFFGDFHKGKGKIKYNDGCSYKGEWENYKRQKKGVLTYPNSDRYEGEFKDDLYNGEGKLFVYGEKMYYKGTWINGKKEGIFDLYDEKDKFIRKKKFKDDVLVK